MDWPMVLNQIVVPILGVVATASVGFAAKKVGDWLKLKEDDARRKVLETALQAAAALLEAKAGATPETAALYVKSSVPQTLEKLGVNLHNLPDMVTARSAMSEAQKTALLNINAKGGQS